MGDIADDMRELEMEEQIRKMFTFTCQHDNCHATGTDRTEFKKVIVRSGAVSFQYVLCNKHATQMLEER